MALEEQIAALATATTELTEQALITLDESAANANRAELARDFSTQEANRATAAQSAITTELAQVQALAEQVAADKDNVTATLIGDEDYIIPAVTQLLSTYTNVVATAISDDIWAEHSHKWGAPKQVLAIAQTGKVALHDLTKPTLPLWREIVNTTVNEGLIHQNLWRGGRVVSAISLCGSVLLLNPWLTTGVDNSTAGLIIIDFAENSQRRITTIASYGGYLNKIDPGSLLIPSNLTIINARINAIATRIADHAPRHPVSGLPMPTIAVATDGGVSELVPTDDGKWTVTNSTQTNKFEAISYSGSGRLYVGNRVLNTAYGNYTDGLKANPSLGLLTYSVPSSTGFNIWQTKAGYSSYRARLIASSVDKLVTYKDNQSDPSKGMTAYSDINHSTPYLVGDTQGAWLCGSEEGVVSGDNLATSLTYSGAIVSPSAGVFDIDVNSSEGAAIVKSGALIIGKTYRIELTVTNYVDGKIADQIGGLKNIEVTGNGVYVTHTVATTTTFGLSRSGSVCHMTVSNIKCTEVAPDYSGRNNHAIIHGSLTRTKPVGSDIAVWSGFDASNYIDKVFTVDPVAFYGVELSGTTLIFHKDALLHSGVDYNVTTHTLTVNGGKWAALVATNTQPTADQWRDLERDMLNKLSKPSMLSGNVKALAYDPIRKQDWVVCDSKKAHRLDGTCIAETVSIDTNVGTISSMTVNDGLITVSGSGGTWIKQPEKNLRAPQIRAVKSVRTFELGEGNGTKVDFYLPRGWKPERAYVDGVKKRKGAQDDWTAQFDGYKWFVRFAVAPAAVDVDVDAVEV